MNCLDLPTINCRDYGTPKLGTLGGLCEKFLTRYSDFYRLDMISSYKIHHENPVSHELSKDLIGKLKFDKSSYNKLH